MANTVPRNTLLGMLEEIRRQQMKKYLLHRMFLVAMLPENTDGGEVIAFHEQLFKRIAKFHLGEPVSGVLLIYSSCILHVLESSSGTLYHILKELAASENQGPEPFLRDVKILVVSHNIPTKLFTQWYATTVDVPEILEDISQTQTTEEVITECLTLILKLGVYLATLKVGNKGLGDCLHSVVPELLIRTETIKYLCKAEKCLSPQEFLDLYDNPLQPVMDSESVWPTPAHLFA
uniref:testis-expressed protein 47-like n=1 Tax=Euleptes europaea TaxID=460621 RepID=UPI00254042B9|nr:testis-expressed protein 47-like [Euleptes europaea]